MMTQYSSGMRVLWKKCKQLTILMMVSVQSLEAAMEIVIVILMGAAHAVGE